LNFPSKYRFRISLFSHTCNNPRPSQTWLDHPNNMWWELKITNLIIMEFFPASCYFFPLTFQHVLQTGNISPCKIEITINVNFNLSCTDYT
jgi:hypothetical protein